jgi:hypothetical protein
VHLAREPQSRNLPTAFANGDSDRSRACVPPVFRVRLSPSGSSRKDRVRCCTLASYGPVDIHQQRLRGASAEIEAQ